MNVMVINNNYVTVSNNGITLNVMVINNMLR